MKQIKTLVLIVCMLFVAQAYAGNYAQTKYPIVLVHGLTGAAKIMGIVDYWWQIPQDLQSNGATVYVATVNAFSGEADRGTALLAQVNTVLAATGAQKVNLIGHSQGGLTSRYLAAIRPDLVASVTTIGTPHRGSEFADYVNSLPPAVVQIIAGAASVYGNLQNLLDGSHLAVEPLQSLAILSTAGAAQFNASYPSAGVGAGCSSGAASEVRQGNLQLLYSMAGNMPFTNALDVTDYGLVATGAVITQRGGGANDGLVSVCSAKFGQELGVYGWNHVDEINHLFGLRGLFSADPVATIRTHANRLKMAGL